MINKRRIRAILSLMVVITLLSTQTLNVHAGWWDDVTDWAEGAVDDVADWTEGAVDDVADWTEGAVDDVADWTEGAVEDVADWTEGAVDDVADWTEGAVDDVANWTEGAVDDVAGWTEGAVDDVADWTEGAVDDISDWTKGAYDDVAGFLGDVFKENPELREIDLLPILELDVVSLPNLLTRNKGSFNYGDNVKEKRLPYNIKDKAKNALKEVGLTDYWANFVIDRVSQSSGDINIGEYIADMLPYSFLYGDNLAEVINEELGDVTLEDIDPYSDGIIPADDVESIDFSYMIDGSKSDITGNKLIVITGVEYGKRDRLTVELKAGNNTYKTTKKALNREEIAFVAEINGVKAGEDLEIIFRNNFEKPADIAEEIASSIQFGINKIVPFGDPISNSAKNKIKDGINELAYFMEETQTDKKGNVKKNKDGSDKKEVSEVTLNDVLGDGDAGVIVTELIYKIPLIGSILNPVLKIIGGEEKLQELIRDIIGQEEVKSYAAFKDGRIAIKSYSSSQEMKDNLEDVVTDPVIDINDYIEIDDTGAMVISEKTLDEQLVKIAESLTYTDASSWALPEMKEAVKLGLVRDYLLFDNCKRYITRQEFAAIAVNLYEALIGEEAQPSPNNTFGDTTDVFVLKANNAGIVTGNNGLFRPSDNVTRQEMAVMFMRLITKAYTNAGKTLESTSGTMNVRDIGTIAPWAKEHVQFVFTSGIITGDGVHFQPLGTAPIEQAIAIAKRVYNKYMDTLNPPPNTRILKDGKGLGGIQFFGGITDIFDSGIIKLTEGDGNTAPMGYAVGDSGSMEQCNQDGIYEANMTFNRLAGNGGIGFNIANPQVGKDMYQGYFAGIDAASNTVYIEKTNYNKQRLVTKPLKMKLEVGTTYNIKAVREGSRIDVYVNNIRHIAIEESTHTGGGYFGVGGYKSDIMIERLAYRSSLGPFKPRPLPRLKIAKDNELSEGIKFYGGESSYTDQGLLKFGYNSESNGPMALAADAQNYEEDFHQNGLYQATLSFDNKDGNAGIAFNVQHPRVGNDQYRGYTAAIDAKNNRVLLGKHNYDWTEIKVVDLGFNVESGKYYNLKVSRDGDRINVYVNNRKYIAVRDDSCSGYGYFGARLYKANVTYRQMSYSKEYGKYKPKAFIVKGANDSTYNNFKGYGDNWSLLESLALWDKNKQGPMVIAYNQYGQNVSTYSGTTAYNAKFKIRSNSGNAGIVFNVSEPSVGNDRYRGYYVGINVEANTAMIGRSNYDWTNLVENKIPFSIKGKVIEMKVVRSNGSRIDVYINGTIVCSTNDSTYPSSGGFGARVWNAAAVYTDLFVTSY